MHIELIDKEKDEGCRFLEARASMKHFLIGYACPKDLQSLKIIKRFLTEKTDLSKLVGFYGGANDDVAFWKVFHDVLKDIIYGDVEYVEGYAPPNPEEFDPNFRMEPLYKRGIHTIPYDHDQPLPSGLEFEILHLQVSGTNEKQLKNYLQGLNSPGYIITNGIELSGWNGSLESGLLVPLLTHNKNFFVTKHMLETEEMDLELWMKK